MKLEFDLNAHTALGILEALEVVTSYHQRPKDPEDEFYFDLLIVLRDAFRERSTDIQAEISKQTVDITWFVP